MSIDRLLKQGAVRYAVSQVEGAVERVESESPIWGRHPLKLAAAQLAIALAAGGEVPESLVTRLNELERGAADYEPEDMAVRTLKAHELPFLPVAQAVIGLMALSFESEGN